MKRNILLILGLVVGSIILAIPFANFVVYKLVFHYSGDWIVPKSIADFANGLPFLYLLLSPILFGIWGKGKKWLWVIVSILPIVVLDIYIGAFKDMWFWSLIFFVSGIILAKLIPFIISKIKHSNPPMVVK
jgi:hypothetical protein